MTVSFITKQIWALSLLSIVCLIVVSASFILFQGLVQANNAAKLSMEVLQENQQALLCLLDCETAYRGYLLTSDEAFLDPDKDCYRDVAKHLSRVQTLTAGNDAQQKRILAMFQLGRDKIRFTQTAIAWRRAHPGFDKPDIPLKEGKALMDKFRSASKEVDKEEYRLLENRRQEVLRSRTAVRIVLGISGALMLLAVLWVALSYRRYEDQQAAIRVALNNARDEAINANKLKSQFVANVSHELRTPLSGILGLSELLTSYDLPTESAELIDHIYVSAQSLVGLVNQILDFSRLEAGKIELYFSSFTLPSLIEQVLAPCMVQAESKGLVLETDIQDGLSAIELCGDIGRVRQILLNLVSNAIKFTARGSVKMTVTKEKEHATQIYLRFQVADTGIGIDEKTKRKLFEPFVQADGSTTRKYGGTGLGLSISLNLVNLMHGTIDCCQNENGGATFWFTVPFEVGEDTACSRRQMSLLTSGDD